MPGMGYITTEYTVWCGFCEEWMQTPNFRTKKRFLQALKKSGWQSHKCKLICPECISKRNSNEQ